MKKFIYLLPLITILFTSCLSNDGNETKQVIQTAYVNRIISPSSGDIVMNNCTYKYDINYTQMTTSITALNLNLTKGGDGISLCGKNLSLSYGESGWSIKSKSSFNPLINGAETTDYTVASMRSTIWDTEANIEYTLSTPNGTYTIKGMTAAPIYLYSSTLVTGAGEPFSWDKAQIGFSLDADNGTAKMQLNQIKFAELMPNALDKMIFPKLKLTPTAAGYELTADKFNPTLDGVEYSKYAISDYNAQIQGSQVYMTFKCGNFNVTINAYMHKQSSEN